jgi:hypothetical protein
MFRSFEVGLDTDEYIDLYSRLSDFSEIYTYSFRYEEGYLIFNWILNIFTNNPRILLIITSLIIFLILSKFIFTYSKIPWFTILLFFTLRYFDISLSGIRQMMALSFVLLSFKYVLEKKIIIFLMTVLFASSFHIASIIFVLAYPLSKIKLSFQFIGLSILVTIGLSYFLYDIIVIVLSYFPRYYSYVFSLKDIGDLKLYTLLNFLILFIIFILGLSLVPNNKNPSKFSTDDLKIFKISEIFVFISVLIMILAMQIDIFSRFKNVYGIFALIYVSNAIYTIKYKNLRFISLFISVFGFSSNSFIISTFPFSIAIDNVDGSV